LLGVKVQAVARAAVQVAVQAAAPDAAAAVAALVALAQADPVSARPVAIRRRTSRECPVSR